MNEEVDGYNFQYKFYILPDFDDDNKPTKKSGDIVNINDTIYISSSKMETDGIINIALTDDCGYYGCRVMKRVDENNSNNFEGYETRFAHGGDGLLKVVLLFIIQKHSDSNTFSAVMLLHVQNQHHVNYLQKIQLYIIVNYR